MPQQDRFRFVPSVCAWAMVCALFVFGVGTSASAQTAASDSSGLVLPAGALQAAQPTSGGPVRRLSVDEAVALSLEQNLGVRVQRLNPQVQDLNVSLARSVWTPNASSTFRLNQRTDQNTGFLSGGTGTATIGTDTVSNTVGVNQLLPWGGASFNVSWNSARTTTNSFFENFNPQLGSNLTAVFVQPLLRDFKINGARQQLLVSQRNREIADIDLRQTVLSTQRNVRNAYWELSYAISSLETNRQSLDLARQSLKDNRARVEIGTMAPIDIVAADAEVAQREEAVILSEAAVEQAMDGLRALMFDPAMPNFWTTRIELTDRPSFQSRPIDVDVAIKEALDKRTDIRQAKKTLETTDINLRFFDNQRMPEVNLQVDYTTRGTGGTELESLRGLPTGDAVPARAIVGQRGYGAVLSDLLTSDFPVWAVQVRVAYPIGRSTAETNLARARLQRQQSLLQITSLELQIAQQVRSIGRQVNTNLKRVDATRASRELAERRLDAEQKKFAAGMGTTFVIFQAQRDLANARTAELRAILDYNRALVDFETVQESPLSGGGIIIQ